MKNIEIRFKEQVGDYQPEQVVSLPWNEAVKFLKTKQAVRQFRAFMDGTKSCGCKGNK